MPLGRAVIPLVGLAAVAAACTPTHYSGALARASREERALLEARAQSRCPAPPPHAFTSDGCSAFPDGDWLACCIEHDFAYWCGGDAAARKSADEGLRACVSQRGHPGIGNVMYYGVRVGGHPLLPFSWRWGYGWDWPYRYP